MAFTKAEKHAAKLRLAITGPSGSGKTFTALHLARGLVGEAGRIACLDTEHGSAAKYCDLVSFDTDPDFQAPWRPEKYVQGIQAAAEAGYDVLVIDSLSHAWAGQGGLLEMVDQIAARSKSQNTFFAWKDATPLQWKLVEAILGAPLHIIATMRSKTKYVQEDVNRGGRNMTVPKKIGMEPVQRDGMEYEFDLVLEMDLDHRGIVAKSRCSELADAVIERPGAGLATTLRRWLDGTPAPARTPAPAPVEASPAAPAEGNGEKAPTEAQMKRLHGWAEDGSLPQATRDWLRLRLERPLTTGQAGKIIGDLKKKLAELAAPEPQREPAGSDHADDQLPEGM